MMREKVMVLPITALVASSTTHVIGVDAGRVLRRPTHHERYGVKRSLVQHPYELESEVKWGEYIAGYPGAEEPSKRWDEEESKSPDSSDDPHPFEDDPDSWEDPQAWYDEPDSWDNSHAWNEGWEHIHGQPEPKGPKGSKGPKGPKGDEQHIHPPPPVDHEKPTKGPRQPEEQDVPNHLTLLLKGTKGDPKHDTPHHSSVWHEYHLEGQHNQTTAKHPSVWDEYHPEGHIYPQVPRPYPVSKDPPMDPTGTAHHQDYNAGADKDETAPDDTALRVVVPFGLQFSVESGRKPEEQELYIISAETASFLTTYLNKFFDKYLQDIELSGFTLVPSEDKDPIVVDDLISIYYTGVIFFDSDDILTIDDMAMVIEDAFLNENLEEYLRRVNSLAHDNVFRSTMEVTILTNILDDSTSKLFKALEEEETDSITSMPSMSTEDSSKLMAVSSMMAAAALVTLAVTLMAFRRKRHRDDDDMSCAESVFIGDKNHMVETEIGDVDFEVSSVSSTNKATRAENFLRLVAREDDYSDTSTFRIEMGGNKTFARA